MRVPCAHVVRGGDGSTAPLDVGVYFAYRATGTQVDVYTAATGGAALTQPITPDSEGRVEVYVNEEGADLEIIEAYQNNEVIIPWTANIAPKRTTSGEFTAPTLTNSWVNYGGGWSTAGYKKLGNGLVILKGLIKNGDVWVPAFTLPAGYRPERDFAAPSQITTTKQGRLWVFTDGRVVPIDGDDVYYSLSNVRFFAAVP